jgi:hypothetical protein
MNFYVFMFYNSTRHMSFPDEHLYNPDIRSCQASTSVRGRKVYRILGIHIEESETSCYALLEHGVEKFVTALRPHDLEMLHKDRTQARSLKVVYKTVRKTCSTVWGVETSV